jgi:hypothetical protein
MASPRSAQRGRLDTFRTKQDRSSPKKKWHPSHGFFGKEWISGADFSKLVIILKTASIDALLVRAESTARPDFSNR